MIGAPVCGYEFMILPPGHDLLMKMANSSPFQVGMFVEANWQADKDHDTNEPIYYNACVQNVDKATGTLDLLFQDSMKELGVWPSITLMNGTLKADKSRSHWLEDTHNDNWSDDVAGSICTVCNGGAEFECDGCHVPIHPDHYGTHAELIESGDRTPTGSSCTASGQWYCQRCRAAGVSASTSDDGKRAKLAEYKCQLCPNGHHPRIGPFVRISDKLFPGRDGWVHGVCAAALERTMTRWATARQSPKSTPSQAGAGSAGAAGDTISPTADDGKLDGGYGGGRMQWQKDCDPKSHVWKEQVASHFGLRCEICKKCDGAAVQCCAEHWKGADYPLRLRMSDPSYDGASSKAGKHHKPSSSAAASSSSTEAAGHVEKLQIVVKGERCMHAFHASCARLAGFHQLLTDTESRCLEGGNLKFYCAEHSRKRNAVMYQERARTLPPHLRKPYLDVPPGVIAANAKKVVQPSAKDLDPVYVDSNEWLYMNLEISRDALPRTADGREAPEHVGVRGKSKFGKKRPRDDGDVGNAIVPPPATGPSAEASAAVVSASAGAGAASVAGAPTASAPASLKFTADDDPELQQQIRDISLNANLARHEKRQFIEIAKREWEKRRKAAAGTGSAHTAVTPSAASGSGPGAGAPPNKAPRTDDRGSAHPSAAPVNADSAACVTPASSGASSAAEVQVAQALAPAPLIAPPITKQYFFVDVACHEPSEWQIAPSSAAYESRFDSVFKRLGHRDVASLIELTSNSINSVSCDCRCAAAVAENRADRGGDAQLEGQHPAAQCGDQCLNFSGRASALDSLAYTVRHLEAQVMEMQLRQAQARRQADEELHDGGAGAAHPASDAPSEATRSQSRQQAEQARSQLVTEAMDLLHDVESARSHWRRNGSCPCHHSAAESAVSLAGCAAHCTCAVAARLTHGQTTQDGQKIERFVHSYDRVTYARQLVLFRMGLASALSSPLDVAAGSQAGTGAAQRGQQPPPSTLSGIAHSLTVACFHFASVCFNDISGGASYPGSKPAIMFAAARDAASKPPVALALLKHAAAARDSPVDVAAQGALNTSCAGAVGAGVPDALSPFRLVGTIALQLL